MATFVAPDPQGLIQRRWRQEGIGLGKRDFMSEEEVLLPVKAVILAEHYPEVLTLIAHADSPKVTLPQILKSATLFNTFPACAVSTKL